MSLKVSKISIWEAYPFDGTIVDNGGKYARTCCQFRREKQP